MSRPWVSPELRERIAARDRAAARAQSADRAGVMRPVSDDASMDADYWGEEHVSTMPVVSHVPANWTDEATWGDSGDE